MSNLPCDFAELFLELEDLGTSHLDLDNKLHPRTETDKEANLDESTIKYIMKGCVMLLKRSRVFVSRINRISQLSFVNGSPNKEI